MAKFYGSVGFADTVETAPDVWESKIVERNYSGDVFRNTRRWQTGPQQLNDNLTASVQISIIADPYAIAHYGCIKYVTLHGTRWKVTSVDPNQRPRLVMEIGELYNGDGPEESEDDDG